MLTFLRISCVNISNSNTKQKHITHIGGLNSVGGKWKMTEKQAIRGIEKKEYSFYVVSNGKTIKVSISTNEFGNEFLTIDDERLNNLLSLPECK